MQSVAHIKKRKKIFLDIKKLRKLELTKNPFLSLARSIIFQQISTKVGTSIYGKFVKLFGRAKPSPKKIFSFSDTDFKNAGVSTQKMSYLRDLALKFNDKTINTKNFHKMSDDEIKEHLVQVKGVGSWTADMFLIFALNRPDVLAVGDLGVQKGFQKIFKLRNLPSEAHMVRLAKPYGGERTYLCLHAWGVLNGD